MVSYFTPRGGMVIFAVLVLVFPWPLTTSFLLEPNAQSHGAEIKRYRYQIVRAYPHDRRAFTQGLICLDGYLYESTGLKGRSSLRKVQLETGKVLQGYNLAGQYFGEGLTNWGSNLLQLTWKSNIGFIYDLQTFRVKQTFGYSGEGWGLTNDGTKIIMSDGTSTLRFLDPGTLQETGRVMVREGGQQIAGLNELEYVRGEIYANVWQSDRVARISLCTGQVVGWIDLHGLLSKADMATPVNVLNGIAYDSQKDRLFVTGKFWPRLFEIKIIPQW